MSCALADFLKFEMPFNFTSQNPLLVVNSRLMELELICDDGFQVKFMVSLNTKVSQIVQQIVSIRGNNEPSLASDKSQPVIAIKSNNNDQYWTYLAPDISIENIRESFRNNNGAMQLHVVGFKKIQENTRVNNEHFLRELSKFAQRLSTMSNSFASSIDTYQLSRRENFPNLINIPAITEKESDPFGSMIRTINEFSSNVLESFNQYIHENKGGLDGDEFNQQMKQAQDAFKNGNYLQAINVLQFPSLTFAGNNTSSPYHVIDGRNSTSSSSSTSNHTNILKIDNGNSSVPSLLGKRKSDSEIVDDNVSEENHVVNRKRIRVVESRQKEEAPINENLTQRDHGRNSMEVEELDEFPTEPAKINSSDNNNNNKNNNNNGKDQNNHDPILQDDIQLTSSPIKKVESFDFRLSQQTQESPDLLATSHHPPGQDLNHVNVSMIGDTGVHIMSTIRRSTSPPVASNLHPTNLSFSQATKDGTNSDSESSSDSDSDDDSSTSSSSSTSSHRTGRSALSINSPLIRSPLVTLPVTSIPFTQVEDDDMTTQHALNDSMMSIDTANMISIHAKNVIESDDDDSSSSDSDSSDSDSSDSDTSDSDSDSSDSSEDEPKAQTAPVNSTNVNAAVTTINTTTITANGNNVVAMEVATPAIIQDDNVINVESSSSDSDSSDSDSSDDSSSDSDDSSSSSDDDDEDKDNQNGNKQEEPSTSKLPIDAMETQLISEDILQKAEETEKMIAITTSQMEAQSHAHSDSDASSSESDSDSSDSDSDSSSSSSSVSSKDEDMDLQQLTQVSVALPTIDDYPPKTVSKLQLGSKTPAALRSLISSNSLPTKSPSCFLPSHQLKGDFLDKSDHDTTNQNTKNSTAGDDHDDDIDSSDESSSSGSSLSSSSSDTSQQDSDNDDELESLGLSELRKITADYSKHTNTTTSTSTSIQKSNLTSTPQLNPDNATTSNTTAIATTTTTADNNNNNNNNNNSTVKTPMKSTTTTAVAKKSQTAVKKPPVEKSVDTTVKNRRKSAGQATDQNTKKLNVNTTSTKGLALKDIINQSSSNNNNQQSGSEGIASDVVQEGVKSNRSTSSNTSDELYFDAREPDNTTINALTTTTTTTTAAAIYSAGLPPKTPKPSARKPAATATTTTTTAKKTPKKAESTPSNSLPSSQTSINLSQATNMTTDSQQPPKTVRKRATPAKTPAGAQAKK